MCVYLVEWSNLTWGMFSRCMADSSRYTLYKISVRPNNKTIKLHKYFACLISPKFVICCAWESTSVTLNLTLFWANMNKILNWPVRFDKRVPYEISTKCVKPFVEYIETSNDSLQRDRPGNHQYHQKYKWSTGAM
jgi:hypothetical protein